MTSEVKEWPGKAFGAPAAGPGAVATLGRRVGAFAVDALVADLIAWAFTAPDLPLTLNTLMWALITVLGVGAFGVTPGHLVAGTRVATLRPAGRSQVVGLWAVPRTLLIALIVPPFLLDRDGRGLHDRLCYTVVVRSR